MPGKTPLKPPPHTPPRSPSPSASADPAPAGSRLLHIVLAASATFILALFLRLAPLLHSLWYDEMFTLLNYIMGPWKQIVAGRYSPNNHILFNLLARTFTLAAEQGADLTALIRLPSLLAGSALGLLLAWPLRRSHPHPALLMALIATLHPWLISISAWARGYALLLFLATLASLLLPAQRSLIRWRYTLTLTAALYTQPIAIALVLGHSLAMLILRRELLWTWLRSAAAAGILTFLLYLPFFAGASQWWSRPETPSVSYRQFIDHSIRHAHAGDDTAGLAALLAPLFIIVAGGLLVWRTPPLRPLLLTFATAALFGFLVPLLVPLAGEVRAMVWLIPLYCLSAAAILSLPPPNRAFHSIRLAGTALLFITLAQHVYRIHSIPAQPVRNAVVAAADAAEPGAKVFGVYLGALEAMGLYGGIDAITYRATSPADAMHPRKLPSLPELEATSQRPPVAIVFYEELIQRDQPDLWRYLQDNYRLIERLPGRISPVALYRRVE